jgi:hypothetical protein
MLPAGRSAAAEWPADEAKLKLGGRSLVEPLAVRGGATPWPGNVPLGSGGTALG